VAVLRILILEDSEADAALMLRELRAALPEVVALRVETEDAFVAALDPEPHLILADFRLPRFDALRALKAVRERGVGAPVIVVSGAIGEDAGAECIKSGAVDYVLKDRLGRLGVAVEQALSRHRLETEKARLEAELEQARRLEELGMFASRIAHDFNNVLAVVDGYAGMIARDARGRQPVAGYVDAIGQATASAAALTRQLLDFGRRNAVQPRLVELGPALSDARSLLVPTLGERVELTVHCVPDLWPVMLEDGQLEQILVNLAVNARDAMPEGGRVTIEAGNLIGARERRVRLSVADTGCGMRPEVAARAFDPFFSTKPHGHGTGLGLATVYAIVTRAGGQARVLTSPGDGTTIEIHLPAALVTDARPQEPAWT
jgi:signal transduction histidine kinase